MAYQPLFEIIRNEILQSPLKMIPFRRFMECCLYHPVWGYYCKDRKKFGKQGDFFTNVQVGSLFGRMLGKIFFHTRSSDPFKGKWALVEMGAGDGQLMQGIISFFHQQFIDDVDFYVVEKKKPTAGMDDKIVWVDRLEAIPPYPFAIIFSNELVDAFPVHRIRKEGGEINEIYVTWNSRQGCFQETLGALSSSALRSHVTRMADQIPEGYECEVSLDMKKWLEEMSWWLTKGYVFTIDYGGETEELLLRKEGTIRYFQKHQLVESSYLQPGDVDITAHVNFTWLREWGTQRGLTATFYGSQTRFLLREDMADLMMNEQERQQFKQLIHPEGMGETFRVLIQKRATY